MVLESGDLPEMVHSELSMLDKQGRRGPALQAALGFVMLWQARLVLARFRKVRSGVVWQVRHGMARPDRARHDKAG